MAKPSDIHRAGQNGSSASQYAPAGTVNVGDTVRILVNASESGHIGVRRAANAILEAMAGGRWRVSAGPHAGGTGSRSRAPDSNRHITISVDGKGYHLQLTSAGNIRRITGDDGVELVAPWLPPGAPV